MSNLKKKQTTKSYNTIGEIFCDLSLMLSPPENLTVSQAAEKYRYVNQPGAYMGPWRNLIVNYMVEPMDLFTSRNYVGLIFVGPAQCAKTDSLVLNTVTYSVKVDPMDMIIYCPGMTEARDFGLRRIDRLHRHSEAVGEMLLPTADADNRFDKQYTTGMLLTLSWPTPATVAGKPVGRAVITDRDRMDDSIGGDGEVFDLVTKRTTTFGSYAMTVCESSPSREVSNPKWTRQSPHEAPPCEGILKLYNRGDRRRWFWPCPDCDEYFEGNFTDLVWKDKKELTHLESPTNKDIAETVRMVCPHCGVHIHTDAREDMQMYGVWVKDGQSVDKRGFVFGPEPRTSIASFWLNGVAAAFNPWWKLVETFLNANDEYERTCSEEALRKFYNNDLGQPYYPKSTTDLRLPEVLKARAENLPEKKVPKGVRFLIATVDVQKNMFVVQVFGILPGLRFDMVLIDRFDLRKSKRKDDDGDALWIKPHANLEDWDVLIEGVIQKDYPLDDDTGRRMSIKMTACDSGGYARGQEHGVTSMAYAFLRSLRERNISRFILTKGDGSPNRPRTRIDYPDSGRKDMKNAARGDIPVLFLNSNVLKDDLDGRLDCIEPGKGMFRFPDWLSQSWYAELCVESRSEKGWENLSGHSNEAWDLSYMAIGVCISEVIRVEKINWSEPPGWAADWDTNDLVRMSTEAKPFANTLKSKRNFGEFAKALA